MMLKARTAIPRRLENRPISELFLTDSRLNEPVEQFSNDTPCGKFQLNVLMAVAEFERGIIRERVMRSLPRQPAFRSAFTPAITSACEARSETAIHSCAICPPFPSQHVENCSRRREEADSRVKTA